MKKILRHNNQLGFFILLLILVIVYKSIDNLPSIAGFFAMIFKTVKPFLVGFIIAYILNIPCKRIYRLLKKSKSKFISKKSKGISILLVYSIALLVIVITVRMLVPAIYENCLDLYANAPLYITKIMNYINSWLTRLNLNIISVDEITDGVKNFIKNIDLTQFSKYAQGVLNLTSGLLNTFISIIASVYMIIDSQRIKNSLVKFVSIITSEEKAESMRKYFKKVNDIFSKYIYCRIIDALIVAVLATAVLYILRVKYALMLGFMIGFCNLIPYFGSIISSIFTILITLVTGGVFQAIWVGVSLFIIEQVDGNFIGPRIMNDILEIRPLWVIFAVTVGGKLFGVIGMLISVPVLVVIKMMVSDYLREKERLKKLNKDKEINI